MTRVAAVAVFLLGSAVACGSASGRVLMTAPRARSGVPDADRSATAADERPNGVEASMGYACVTTSAGRVWCWGAHPLVPGVGAGEARPVPGVYRVRSLSLGSRHACALHDRTPATCWGSVEELRPLSPLRDGAGALAMLPPTAIEIGDTVEMRASEDHICARTRAGQVWCGARDDEARTPARMMLPSFFLDPRLRWSWIAVGTEHVCGLRDGLVRCSGAPDGPWRPDRATGCSGNDFQDGSTGIRGWQLATDIAAAAFYTCAATHTHQVFCWGRPPEHQLYRTGDPCASGLPGRSDEWGIVGATGPRLDSHENPRSLFVEASRDPAVIAGRRSLSAGHDHACALDGEGHAVCWGDNADGQLGDGTIESRAGAVRVALEGIERIAAGAGFTCALLRSGQVSCWGSDAHRQLGRRRAFGPAPGRVSFGARVREVAVGGRHLCALLEGGRVVCLGDNDRGQLGRRGVAMSREPLDVGLDEVEHIAAADRHTCAVRRGGTVWCWGDDQHFQASGEPGNDRCEPRWQPGPVAGVTGAVAVSVAPDHGCALSRAGEVTCWGDNAAGQLGAAGPLDLVAAVRGVPRFAQVSAGEGRTCARTATGQVWCWGATPDPEPSPVPPPAGARTPPLATPSPPARVELPAPAVAIWGSTALLEDGRVLSWQVPVPAGWPPEAWAWGRLVDQPVGIGAGCALDRSGVVGCAGDDDRFEPTGRLGTYERPERGPVRIEGVPPAVSLVGGWATSCVLTAEGEVWCWGRPIPSFDPTPAPVEGLPR